MKKSLLLCTVGALACSLSWAQDPNPPQPPPRENPAPPSPGATPPPPPRFPAPERGPDNRRPDQRPGRPEDGQRGFRRDGEGREGQPGPGGPRAEQRGDQRDQRGGERPGMRGPWQGGERGWRGPGGPGGFPGRPEQMPPGAPAQPQAFLGVMTIPSPAPLSAQLSLPEGFGLLVVGVMPGSPAAEAGIKQFDILRYLDDQQLAEPGQLAALVRTAGKGKEVALTVIRQAKEQKITVKIGERMAPPEPRFPELRRMMEEHQERMRGMQDRTRDMQERARDMQEEMRRRFQEQKGDREEKEKGERRQGPGSDRRPAPDERPGAAIAPEDILRQARPDGGSRIEVATSTGVTTMEGAKSRFHLSDNDGEIDVAGENGHRTLTAHDRDGKLIFTGPVDTYEQRQAIPQALREKIEKIRIRGGGPNAFGFGHEGAPRPEANVQ